ncbi:unnamed protein product, partial [Ectocarpus sp. 4 AP-2014]
GAHPEYGSDSRRERAPLCDRLCFLVPNGFTYTTLKFVRPLSLGTNGEPRDGGRTAILTQTHCQMVCAVVRSYLRAKLHSTGFLSHKFSWESTRLTDTNTKVDECERLLGVMYCCTDKSTG